MSKMKKHFFVSILAALLCLGLCLPALSDAYQPLPTISTSKFNDRFYQNPSALSGIGDPFLLKEGDYYYCYATNDGTAKGDGFYVYRTTDLTQWGSAKKIHVFEGSNWTNGYYWGPEVHYYNGQYVMFYNARLGEGTEEGGDLKLRLGIAVSDSPEGPFIDPLGKPLLEVDYCCIDAHLFVDDDGTPYLFFARDNYDNWIGPHQVSQIYGVQLAPDLMSVVGEPVMLSTPTENWEKITLNYSHYMWNEGVHVLKNEGNYYLFYCANYTSMHDYCYGVAISEEPLANYVKQEENPLLHPMRSLSNNQIIVSGPGNGAFITIGDEIFCSYHVNASNTNPTMNRTLCIDRVGFHADGTAFINGVSRMKKQLLPLFDLGLVNQTKGAVILSDGDSALLKDGDYCISNASVGYLWKGTEATFTWDEGVKADMLMIYPKLGSEGTGRVIINDQYVQEIDLKSAGAMPGSAVIIGFEELEISSLRLEWDSKVKLGEILVIGPEAK